MSNIRRRINYIQFWETTIWLLLQISVYLTSSTGTIVQVHRREMAIFVSTNRIRQSCSYRKRLYIWFFFVIRKDYEEAGIEWMANEFSPTHMYYGRFASLSAMSDGSFFSFTPFGTVIFVPTNRHEIFI